MKPAREAIAAAAPASIARRSEADSARSVFMSSPMVPLDSWQSQGQTASGGRDPPSSVENVPAWSIRPGPLHGPNRPAHQGSNDPAPSSERRPDSEQPTS